jgi:hypothetical protein
MSGLFADPAGTTVCVSCSISNCLTCFGVSGGFSCSLCDVGYAWTGAACLSCPAALYCQTATNAGGACVCTACRAGYALDGGNCIPCSTDISNCVLCSDRSHCTSCNVGYLLNVNVCQACPHALGCSTCTFVSCLTCSNGTLPNANGSCITTSPPIIPVVPISPVVPDVPEEATNSLKALEVMTYITFFISLIPAKIIGLEMIGVLQLAYFTLAQ